MGIRSKKNYEDAIERWEHKGAQEWAKAKNNEGGEHYEKARQCYNNAKANREKLKKYYGE